MRLMPAKAEKAPEQASTDKPHTALSTREKQVLEYITKGFTADEIANLMSISRHTVQTFVRRIYSKLEVSSKAEAIYEARNRGLLND
jgi:DNA-binding NarL/FixJ family response regulator